MFIFIKVNQMPNTRQRKRVIPPEDDDDDAVDVVAPIEPHVLEQDAISRRLHPILVR
jgi:hypothetical protein